MMAVAKPKTPEVDLSGLLAASYMVQAFNVANTQRSQGYLAEAEGRFRASQFEINADFSELAAADAITRGDDDVIEYQKQVNALKAQQRVGFAAQGVRVDRGSAAEIQEQTAEIGAFDVVRIKNNAWLEAFGHKQDASRSRFNAQAALISGASASNAAQMNANNTLLGGAINAADSLYGRRGAPDNPDEKVKTVKTVKTPRAQPTIYNYGGEPRGGHFGRLA